MSTSHPELPRYYLRGFADIALNKVWVWVFEKGRPFLPGQKKGKHNPYARGLRQVGLRPDRYVGWSRHGERHFEYEKVLQQKEHIADEVIRKVRRFETISVADKEVLARYVGLMVRRVRARDEYPV